MATEKLIVLLDAKTKNLDSKLVSTENKLDNLEKKTKKADESLVSLGSAAKSVAGVALKLGTAVLAVNAAITAMVLASSKNRRQLERLSSQAKTSTEDFQALAFATSSYATDAEKIGDISKDISDRVGEFSAAGTGAFQDYADVIKLTKDEARAAAIQFQSMSSQEVLGKMVSEMERAGVTGDQMTFVFESISGEASRILPLFRNNSKELKTLKDRFKDVNKELQITDLQADKLKEVSTTYSLMTKQIGNATTAISATLAPVMDDFFNDVIAVVPTATQTIIDFINSFLDAENITTISGVTKQIEASQLRLKKLEEERKDIAEQDVSFRKDAGFVQASFLKQTDEAIEKEKIRTEELREQIKLLEEQQLKLEDVNRLKGGQIGGEGGVLPTVTGIGTGEEIQAIADRFKNEEDLLIEKLDRELAIIGDNKALRLELEDEFLGAIVALDQAAEDDKAKAREKALKDEIKDKVKAAKSEAKIEIAKAAFSNRVAQTLLSSSLSTSEKLFSIVKDAAAGQIEAWGLTAAAKDVALHGTLIGGAIGASTIAWSQVAAGIVRAIPMSGGGGSGGGSPTSQGGASQTSQQSFQPETSSLELTEQSETSNRTITLVLEDGRSLGEVVMNDIEEATRQGR